MIYQFNPLGDLRWEPFVQTHPNSSIFHTSGWLEALRRTYGYEPVVYTTSPPHHELTNGVVLCRLSSWLTGKRLVSLPFSDHCDPLLENGNGETSLFEELCGEQASGGWSYVELRPRRRFKGLQSCMHPGRTYCFHALGLSPSLERLFSKLHVRCTQAKIRRAEKEKLTCREGHSSDLMKMFYHLVLVTRKKQGMPAQPSSWFGALAECLGPVMKIRLAMFNETPVAGIVTLRLRNTVIVKYIAADPRFRNLGGTQWLLWRVVKEAKDLGLQEVDLGRSDWATSGLITFKDRLGARRSSLNYWWYPRTAVRTSGVAVFRRPVSWVVGHTPLWIIGLAGRILYRHIG